MYYFSDSSKAKLDTCDARLIVLMNHVIEYYDFTILCGHRGEEEQNELYSANPPRTTLQYPLSRHNKYPSQAIDIAPYPIDWNNLNEFYYLAGLVTGIGEHLGIKVEWGGRWKNFPDLPHFQLV